MSWTHFNHNLDKQTADSKYIPVGDGDRYWAQDMVHDFEFHRTIMADMIFSAMYMIKSLDHSDMNQSFYFGRPPIINVINTSTVRIIWNGPTIGYKKGITNAEAKRVFDDSATSWAVPFPTVSKPVDAIFPLYNKNATTGDTVVLTGSSGVILARYNPRSIISRSRQFDGGTYGCLVAEDFTYVCDSVDMNNEVVIARFDNSSGTLIVYPSMNSNLSLNGEYTFIVRSDDDLKKVFTFDNSFEQPINMWHNILIKTGTYNINFNVLTEIDISKTNNMFNITCEKGVIINNSNSTNTGSVLSLRNHSNYTYNISITGGTWVKTRFEFFQNLKNMTLNMQVFTGAPLLTSCNNLDDVVINRGTSAVTISTIRPVFNNCRNMKNCKISSLSMYLSPITENNYNTLYTNCLMNGDPGDIGVIVGPNPGGGMNRIDF
jgi:hypothetical protein